MRKMPTYQIIFLFFLLTLWSCSEKAKKAGFTTAKGKSGEIFVLMDSSYWFGKVGSALRTSVAPPIPTPQPEPLFGFHYIHTLQWPQLLKEHRNLFFAFTLNGKSAMNKKIKGLFTGKALDKIQKDTSLHLVIKDDLFAKKQKAVFFFARNEKELIYSLQKNKEKLQNFYTKNEEKFVFHSLKNKKALPMISRVKEKMGLDILLPKGFQIATDSRDFIWFRHPEVAFDLNIFIARKNYTQVEEFKKEAIITWRNQLAKTHIYGNPADKESFMITETLLPVEQNISSIDGRYAVKLQGLWRTHTISMGGPFISFVFLDREKTYIYYAEGFVYAPGKKKRELLRKLETILAHISFIE